MPDSGELEPMPEAARALPSPREFGAQLRTWLDDQIVRVRTLRGETSAPEDTHALVRSLRGFEETAGEYARAWSGAAKVAKQEIENELIEAVGEQDGVPQSGMAVPDHDGTSIRISLDTANSYDIDENALYPALAEVVLMTTDVLTDIENACLDAALAEPEDRPRATAERNAVVARALIVAMTELPRVGTFTAQVTKVRALAAELGRLGDDALASTVTGAIRKTTTYRGVKTTREQPKEEKKK